MLEFFFDKKDLHDVKNAIHNLYQVAEKKFGSHIVGSMLDENKLKKAKSSDEIELQHANTLKRITGNPQEQTDIDENSQPVEQHSRVYFGSYVEVAKGNLTQASEITEETQEIEYNGDINTVITKLTKCYNELKSTMESQISSTVSSVVDAKIKPLYNNKLLKWERHMRLSTITSLLSSILILSQLIANMTRS